MTGPLELKFDMFNNENIIEMVGTITNSELVQVLNWRMSQEECGSPNPGNAGMLF